MAAGLAVIYASGVAWLAFGARLPQALGVRAALVSGAGPFFVADVMKICVAASALPAVWRLTGLGRAPTDTRQ
jgi:biotin transporter BioY